MNSLCYGAIAIYALAFYGYYAEPFQMLSAWYHGAVTMKPTTAITGMMTGIFIITCESQRRILETVSGLMLMASIFYMGGVVFSGLLSDPAASAERFTVMDGTPSGATLVGFILVISATLMRMLHNKTACALLAFQTLTISLISLAGHLVRVPALFFYIPEHSTGMAVPTAISQALLAAYLVFNKTESPTEPD